MAQGRDPKSVGYLYFINSPEQEAYKVGFANDPMQRLRTLQTANPSRLVLEGAVRATYEAEQAFHALMAAYRIRLEWYRPDDAVEMVIAELRDDAMDRAMVWLADNHPDSTDPDMISQGYDHALTTVHDVRRIVREVTEDEEVIHMSEKAARALEF